MNRVTRRSWLTFAALAGVLAAPFGASTEQKPTAMTVFKTATCGCCNKWVDHMKAAGFEADVRDVEDIDAVKAKLGVRPELSSCHTTQVGGYIVEGHVPADAVRRLLKERPQIAGLAVPGMPAGSPGMEVPSGHRDPYVIVAFERGGQTKVYERR
jgi:hypothetical protein